MENLSKFLNPTDDNFFENLIENIDGGRNIFLTGGAGCLARGTPVIMHDGSIKEAQNIKINEIIMGPDSGPRKITQLYRGRAQMLRVDTIKGDSYVCNRNHVHTFVASFNKCGFIKNQLYDMTYDDFLKIPPSGRKALKTIRAKIDFQKNKLQFDPRVVGIWLGEGGRTNKTFCIGKRDKILLNYVTEKFKNKYDISIYDKKREEQKNAITFAKNNKKSKGWGHNEFKNFLHY